MQHFTAAELQRYLQSISDRKTSPPPLLLDVREPWEYQHCHLENSKLVPMRQIPEYTKELDPKQEIVLICHHGIRSRQVAQYLESLGYTQLINLTGGVEAWAEQVDPGMKRY